MTDLILLEQLVEESKADRGYPFQAENLELLAELKDSHLDEFERIRTRLKDAGVRVGELDSALRRSRGGGMPEKPSPADILLSLAANVELFHTPDQVGYAEIPETGHRATWSVRSRSFKQWLTNLYYLETGSAPSAECLSSVINTIEARACYSGEQRDASVRMAGQDDRIYLDLTDDAWRAVEIRRDGWSIIQDPPTRFRRTRGMLPLPDPVRGGEIGRLRKYLNVGDDDFILVVAWMLAVLRHQGPYPVLVLSGEQGSAKSTFTSIMRSVLDPHTVALRSLPKSDRDLFIAATNGYLLAFDNVSGLPAWLSDTLCRLATGGGFSVRTLYTDQEETLFDATRPLILNGIEDFVTRPDLADRAIVLPLEPISADKRRPIDELMDELAEEIPAILGALLDGVAYGLRHIGQTTLDTLPRMADFAKWACACEGQFWEPGAFLAAYERNRAASIHTVIESDLVASAVRQLLDDHPTWSGTATGLRSALEPYVPDGSRRTKAWPADARGLSGRLKRCATFLRTVGISIENDRVGKSRQRQFILSKDTVGRTQNAEADAGGRKGDDVCVRHSSFQDMGLEQADAGGRKIPEVSRGAGGI